MDSGQMSPGGGFGDYEFGGFQSTFTVALGIQQSEQLQEAIQHFRQHTGAVASSKRIAATLEIGNAIAFQEFDGYRKNGKSGI